MDTELRINPDQRSPAKNAHFVVEAIFQLSIKSFEVKTFIMRPVLEQNRSDYRDEIISKRF